MESGRIGAAARGSQGVIRPPTPDGCPRLGTGNGRCLYWFEECTLQMAGRILQHEIFGCHPIRL